MFTAQRPLRSDLTRALASLLALAAVLSSTGCGEGAECADDSSCDAAAGAQGAWTPLITGSWILEPGKELPTFPQIIFAERDMHIGGFRPISPPGTHHTLLAFGGAGTGHIVYAAGIGSNEVVLPKGVGMTLHEGENIILQLHVYNTTSETLSGTSGIEVLEVPADSIEHEATLFLPGPQKFTISPGQTYTHSAKCTIKQAQTYFTIFPHMHQLGTHMKTTFVKDGVEKVIHDGDYVFEHQPFLPMEPITLNPGDVIKNECTWKNNTPNVVEFGESSTAEMCFSILLRYSDTKADAFCTE